VAKYEEVHLDYETRSAAELKTVGASAYFEHGSTDVWCAAYAFDDETDIKLWWFDDDPPQDLLDHIAAGKLVIAHNAAFERTCTNLLMTKKYGWPKITIEQTRCTAAMCRAMSLPGDLGRAAMALNLTEKKDAEGSRTMMQMAKPRGKNIPYEWWDLPQKRFVLGEYCKQDVRTEKGICEKVRVLDPVENRVWMLDQHMNERGVRIDVAAVKDAKFIAAHSLNKLNKEIAHLTRHEVGTVNSHGALKTWLGSQGYEVDSTDKEAMERLSEREDLTPLVRRVCGVRQEAGKSSVAKLESMLDRLSIDGRVRENLIFCAAHTGRWGGVGIQMHNFPRPEEWYEDDAHMANVFDVLSTRDPALVELLLGYPLHVIANALRGFVIADPGKVLLRADFSNIEGRVLAWLAREKWKLQAFRDFDTIVGFDEYGGKIRKGEDLYKLTAGGILGKPAKEVTKKERQERGKVPELALGFQGGVGAFQAMAKTYGVKIDDHEADLIKLAWREKNPNIKQYWYDIEDAAMSACVRRGVRVDVDRVSFAVAQKVLWCKLPSGRLKAYPDPQIREVETPWGETKEAVTYMAINSKTKKWERHKGYGGHFVENIVQAVARDVMRDAMLRSEEQGYPLVLTVHDELVAEVDEDRADVSAYEALLCELPAWADGLPVAAEGAANRRYGK